MGDFRKMNPSKSKRKKSLESRLKEFAEYVLKQYAWDYDLDGGDVQDKAEELRLIELRPIPEEQSEDGESEHYFPVWSLK